MAKNSTHIRGQNCKLRLLQNGKPVIVAAKNWDLEQLVTEVSEGVNGETRDRYDLVINGYSLSVDIYQENEEIIQAMLDAQDAFDSGPALPQSMVVILEKRDGTNVAYLCKGCVFGPFKQTFGGKSDPVMVNLKVRFQDLKPLKT